MILDRLDRAGQYAGTHPLFAAAFKFLAKAGLAELPDGRHETGAPGVFALVSRTSGRGREASPIEAHDRYIDIQLITDGADAMGWRDRATCRQVRTAYNAEKDIAFYDDAPLAWFDVPSGYFAIFFPEDGHAPLAGAGPVHKVVIKVPVKPE